MIAALALLAAAAERPAQTQPKREVVQAFATCVRRRAPDRAKALIATKPGSPEEHRITDVIGGAYNACIAGRSFLSFQVGMLRGQLAEMAFQEDAGMRAAAQALGPVAPVKPDVAELDKRSAKAPAADRDRAFAEAFRPVYADCVAGANPRAVAGLLATAPASPEERAATLAIGEPLMQCMPTGLSYRIIPSELRPYLMSALYYAAATARAKG